MNSYCLVSSTTESTPVHREHPSVPSPSVNISSFLLSNLKTTSDNLNDIFHLSDCGMKRDIKIIPDKYICNFLRKKSS